MQRPNDITLRSSTSKTVRSTTVTSAGPGRTKIVSVTQTTTSDIRGGFVEGARGGVVEGVRGGGLEGVRGSNVQGGSNPVENESDAQEIRSAIFGRESGADQSRRFQPRSLSEISSSSSSVSSTSNVGYIDDVSSLPSPTTTSSILNTTSQRPRLREHQRLDDRISSKPNNTFMSKMKNAAPNNKSLNPTEGEHKVEDGVMMDFLSFALQMRPEMIQYGSPSQLMIALPLILHRIAASHAANKASPLVEPLVRRMLACRKLKLRFLLLRRLESFQPITVTLRFSSRAYDAPPGTWITTACSLSHMNVWAEPRPRALVIPVDMVDLQSDDFYANVVFFKFNGHVDGAGDVTGLETGCGPRQIGQELICHPFYTCGKQNSRNAQPIGGTANRKPFQKKVSDDFTYSNSEGSFIGQQSLPFSQDDSESDEDNEDEDDEDAVYKGATDKGNEILGQFGFICEDNDGNESILEIRRITSDDEEIQVDKLETMLPRILLSEHEDMLRFQAIQMLFHVMNSVWKSPVYYCEDPLSAPFCATMDYIPTSATKGLIESFPLSQPLSALNILPRRSLQVSSEDVASARNRNIWMDSLIRSAAGALTLGYIIGLQLKQGDELFIKGSDCVFWRKFPAVFDVMNTSNSSKTGKSGNAFVNSNALMNSNAFGGGLSRTSIPKGLKELFESFGVWDQFRKLCVSTFQTVRLAWRDVFPLVAPLFSDAGISHQTVEQYVRSRSSLHLKHNNSQRAEFQFRRWLS